MNETTVNRLLAAFLAMVTALRLDMGKLPVDGDLRDTIAWVLTGIGAGLSVYLGPQIADAVKAALRGTPPPPPPLTNSGSTALN